MQHHRHSNIHFDLNSSKSLLDIILFVLIASFLFYVNKVSARTIYLNLFLNYLNLFRENDNI